MGWLRIFVVPREPASATPSWPVRALSFSLVLLALGLVFTFAFHQLNYHWGWAALYKYRRMFVRGWFTTVWISVVSLALSTLIGLGVALARRGRLLPLRYFSRIYVEVVRGTPLLVQILIFFYVVADAFRVENRYLVGVLTLSIFSGAYLSEIIRAGIESVGQSQLESAKAIGLTRVQAFRYVVFPQALRQTLPALAGQFVSLIKDSSLLSIIGINEFTLNAQQVNSQTFSTLESYLPLAIGYLILTLPISLWTRRLEQRLKYET
ncbi:MAG: amino acid ABC transporter permease [Limisphaerales bacterium]